MNNIVSLEKQLMVLIHLAMEQEEISQKLDVLLTKFDTLIETQKRDFRTESEWIDKQDTMKVLKCSERTLQSLRDSGILSYSRPLGGTKIFYRRKDVMDLFEKNFTGTI
jgi:hypothetical protein